MNNKKDDLENKAFEDTMHEAEAKGELGGKQGKLIPMEEYEDAKKGVKVATEEAPDPKDHDFSKYILNDGRVLIYVPEIPKTTKTGLSVDEKTRAIMAEEAKDSTNYRVYGVSENMKKIKVGDGIMVGGGGNWLVIKIDGFTMKIVEDYQVSIIIKGEYV